MGGPLEAGQLRARTVKVCRDAESSAGGFRARTCPGFRTGVEAGSRSLRSDPQAHRMRETDSLSLGKRRRRRERRGPKSWPIRRGSNGLRSHRSPSRSLRLAHGTEGCPHAPRNKRSPASKTTATRRHSREALPFSVPQTWEANYCWSSGLSTRGRACLGEMCPVAVYIYILTYIQNMEC